MLFKALLVALWVTWGLIDEQTIQLQTTRPIITGVVTGLILGDVATGLTVGALVELMFLATVRLPLRRHFRSLLSADS